MRKKTNPVIAKKRISKEFVAIILVVVAVIGLASYFFIDATKDKTDRKIAEVKVKMEQIDINFNNAHKKNIDNDEYIKALLDHLVNKDQFVRHELVKNLLKETKGDIVAAGYDKERVLNYIKSIDMSNVAALNEVLDKYTWPKISQFGTKADIDAWVIVQHADFDPLLQLKSLFFLEQFATENETNEQNYALLYDRVAIKYQGNGIKQKFGTQGKVIDGKFQVHEYIGSEYDINQRRYELGFPPIQEFIDAVNKKYEQED